MNDDEREQRRVKVLYVSPHDVLRMMSANRFAEYLTVAEFPDLPQGDL